MSLTLIQITNSTTPSPMSSVARARGRGEGGGSSVAPRVLGTHAHRLRALARLVQARGRRAAPRAAQRRVCRCCYTLYLFVGVEDFLCFCML